ncbi:glutamate-5-semialdehyde dehydrogenase [Longirhabdus pacifica]|uniref:glutamate-5-semialdehyde dehydrogenase n=1 Tax=Longirhabdus pacifica TaxID=2305227 RepID=UPI00100914D8|nr:glutamate-5-semialdehyde dehydrogenase [Longirhabdus pacifica]
MSDVKRKAELAASAKQKLIRLTTEQKNEALQCIANALGEQSAQIFAANQKDLQHGKENGLSDSLLDRLALNENRVAGMQEGIEQIISLPDPIGDEIETLQPENGLNIKKVRVPIGVIGMIYEARPNVTIDAIALGIKTGNAVILRGGSAALYSNEQLVNTVKYALEQTNVPASCVQLVADSDRQSVQDMLKLNGLIDVIIPRGGAGLINHVVQHATVPVIETGAGICHTYIDREANVEMATNIVMNAKVQRPSVCNAMETLLVHEDFAQEHLLSILEAYRQAGVELRGCNRTKTLLPSVKEATDTDWDTEYNDYILSIKIVNHMDEAITHIHQHGTMHSECIVTDNQAHAATFLQQVDAAAVYHNASTRFTDGFEFGFGAEIGISTQKLHARGPMGLHALTSSKYTIYGTGQTK